MQIYLVYKQLGEPYIVAAFTKKHMADLFAEENNCRFVQPIMLDGEVE